MGKEEREWEGEKGKKNLPPLNFPSGYASDSRETLRQVVQCSWHKRFMVTRSSWGRINLRISVEKAERITNVCGRWNRGLTADV